MARHPGNNSLMAGAPNLDSCTNPECTAKFKKLGDGVLFAETVDNPLAWGLPRGKKQKVVWLCAGCAKVFDLAFDASERQVVLHPRRGRDKRMAA
jgi:hypothetical protein